MDISVVPFAQPPREKLVMCRNDAVVIDCAKLETASLRYGKTASELKITTYSDDRMSRHLLGKAKASKDRLRDPMS